MSEIRKVAVLLIALGPDRARRILDRLGPDDMLAVITEMRRMSKVTPDERAAVLEEVNDLLENLTVGGPEPHAPDFPDPAPPGSALSILDPVKDELPPAIDPDRLRGRDIDWGAAGFDFGARQDPGEDDDPTPPPSDRRR